MDYASKKKKKKTDLMVSIYTLLLKQPENTASREKTVCSLNPGIHPDHTIAGFDYWRYI